MTQQDQPAPIWEDHRSQHPVGAPLTHALIVGVSDYPFCEGGPLAHRHDTLGVGQLTCAAVSAYRFAEWVRDEYRNDDAPLGTIRLLLAPSAAEARATPGVTGVGGSVGDATKLNVREAVQAWRDDCQGNPDDVAILYAAGHGLVRTQDAPVVLLSDFGASELVFDGSLDINNVVAGMRPVKARTQFYFVDACATRPEAVKKYGNGELGSGAVIRSWDGPERRVTAPIFQAAASGTAAYGVSGDWTVFGAALRDCLNGAAAENFEGAWRITVSRLMYVLPKLVEERSQRLMRRQDAHPGGRLTQARFHTLGTPPPVSISVALEPVGAAPFTVGSLKDHAGVEVVDKIDFTTTNPFVDTQTAGVYTAVASIARTDVPFVSREESFSAVPFDGGSAVLEVGRIDGA